MASPTVQEMIDEEPEMNLTPMIDVVFLLLVFFMLMKFKSYEMKLDSYLPKDVGPNTAEPEIIPNLTIKIELLPDSQTEITIRPTSDQAAPPPPIEWEGVQREDGFVYAADSMWDELRVSSERFIEQYLTNPDAKIIIDPQQAVPMEYVVLALDALTEAQANIQGRTPGFEPRQITFSSPVQ